MAGGVILLTKNPHLYKEKNGRKEGLVRELENVSKQMFQMALLLFKEKNCSKLF